MKTYKSNHMKIGKSVSGACPLGNRQAYVSPEVETMEVEMRDLIAVSADNVDVRDPWRDDEEKEW